MFNSRKFNLVTRKKYCGFTAEKRKGYSMKKLSSYILHYWYAYLFAIICLLLQVGLDMLAPQVTRQIVDNVIGEGKIDLLTPLLFTIFFIGLGRCVFGYTKEFTFDCIGSKIGMDMW